MQCGMCGAEQSRAKPYCWRCEDKLRKEAEKHQERDYLARWLSTRVDAQGNVLEHVPTGDRRTVRRLVRWARKTKLDWTQPREPKIFDARMRGVAAKRGITIGRGRKAEKAS